MIAPCKLCRELVTGAPVLAVGPDRPKAEFLAFSEAMRAHVATRHKDSLQVFGAIIQSAVLYFSALFADLSGVPDDVASEPAAFRDALVSTIQACDVVIERRPAAAG